MSSESVPFFVVWWSFITLVYTAFHSAYVTLSLISLIISDFFL